VSLRGTDDSHQHGDDINAPLRTISAGGTHHALIAGSLTKYFSSKDGKQDHAASLHDPLPTVTQVDHNGLVAANLVRSADCLTHEDRPALNRDLVGAIRTARWLMTYAGDDVPVEWIEVDGERQPVVLVRVDGTTYLLTDLGLRMLQPRELARAQGFPETYVLQGSKRAQIAGIGNSVCPPVAEALIRAIFGFSEPAEDSDYRLAA
jgi:DNA (cytosine-5)-methyltransferase 1